MSGGTRHRWIPVRVDGVAVDPARLVVGIEALRQLARCERCGLWKGRRSGDFAEYGIARPGRGSRAPGGLGESWTWTPRTAAELPRSRTGHARTFACDP